MYYDRKMLREVILLEMKKLISERGSTSGGASLTTSAGSGKTIGSEGGASKDVKIHKPWGEKYGQYSPAELADSFLLRFFGLPKSVEDLWGSLFGLTPGNMGLFPQIWATGGDITRLVIRVLTETIHPAEGRLGDDWFVTTFPRTSSLLTQGVDTATGRSSQGRFSWGKNVPGGRIQEAAFDLTSIFSDDEDEVEDLEVDKDEEQLVAEPEEDVEIVPDVGSEAELNDRDTITNIIDSIQSDLAEIQSTVLRLRSSGDLMGSVRIYKEIVPVNTDNSDLQEAINQSTNQAELDQINDEFIENIAIPFIKSLLDDVQASFQQSASLPVELRSAAAVSLEDTISKL